MTPDDATPQTVYIATLKINDEIEPLASKIENIGASAERINSLRPLNAGRRLRKLRKELFGTQPEFGQAMRECFKKMADPVHRAPAADNAWYQGWSTAMGYTAVTRLSVAFTSASATIDRKTAYTVAAFSLYVALISLLLTTVFGWLSLPANLRPI